MAFICVRCTAVLMAMIIIVNKGKLLFFSGAMVSGTRMVFPSCLQPIYSTKNASGNKSQTTIKISCSKQNYGEKCIFASISTSQHPLLAALPYSSTSITNTESSTLCSLAWPEYQARYSVNIRRSVICEE